MSFAVLNAAAVELRNSLRSFVGERAIDEVTVAPPASQDDEISFLKLVSWSYVLVFEAGRVSIGYLLQLPSGGGTPVTDPIAARELVHDLRTWSFHNLGFVSDRDRAISKRVRLWFVQTCGACPPHNREGWRSCFLALCNEMQAIAEHCQGAMTTVLSAADDGEAATSDLRKRIDRAWPAYEFHRLIDDAAVRLGITIDPNKFSEGRIANWRKYLECLPDCDDLDGEVLRIMERDLLTRLDDMLPIDARDVMEALDLDPGPAVGSALLRARELFRSGVRDRHGILAGLTGSDADVLGEPGTANG